MYATAYQLIGDCRQWEQVAASGTPIPAHFAVMSQAMLRVAAYIRSGKLPEIHVRDGGSMTKVVG